MFMGEVNAYTPAQLVIPTLISRASGDDEERFDHLRRELHASLEQAFGAVGLWGEAQPFEYTSYYRTEMGPRITRVFFAAHELLAADSLAACKIASNHLEERFTGPEGRRVNLDPGFLLPGRFLLATTKDAAHRIPLRDGIYAEVTLLFRKGDFQPQPWTYADYRSDAYRAVLRAIRAAYMTRLRRS